MIALACLLATFQSEETAGGFPGLAAGRAPKVEIAWNRLYDEREIHELFARLEGAWPGFLRRETIGRSYEEREMIVWVLTNPATGSDREKPAMWVDGNVHGNEVQGAEAVVYLAWYLLENMGSNEAARAFVDDTAFYLLPMVNPDGRASWFRDAHSSSSSRTGRKPRDDDGDGRADEDPPNDLDGDGNLGQMWKHIPGRGTHRRQPDDPRRFEPVPQNELGLRGDWIMLGSEGIDDDGDGENNEDGVGGYDMNRSWPSSWAPNHVQFGAGDYPLCWPETRAIASFILDHPNIAAVQSFHNSGGMILRGPGRSSFGEYPSEDVRVFDRLGKDGERMLPFYRSMVIWKDLYTVWGGFVNWTYEGLGIVSFTNEMWTPSRMSPGRESTAGPRGNRDEQMFFDDALLLGAGFKDYTEVEHPLYGSVLVGGFAKDVGRVPPSFMIEEETHRNALFCLRHAGAMPKVEIERFEIGELGGSTVLDVSFRNLHAIPTRTARAAEKKIGRPDEFTLRGGGIRVLAGGFRSSEFRPQEIELAEREPERLVSERGIGGEETVRVRWLFVGKGEIVFGWRGEKGRAVSRKATLK